jgi:hypothetical protein
MESVKLQFLELSSPATLRPKADGLKVRTSGAPTPSIVISFHILLTNQPLISSPSTQLDLLAASTNLSNCLSELTSPRGDSTMRFVSPRAPRNGLSLSAGSINTP